MTDDDNGTKLVIEGITTDGTKFRPSDWAERICGNMSTFKNRRIYYSPLLMPTVRDGNKCLIVEKALEESNPSLYKYILGFAKKNKLKICSED
jgi:hypothetical protein